VPPRTFFLSALIALGIPLSASAGTFIFSDVTLQHESAPAITFLKDRKVTKGYTDGSFKPDRTITRAEFVKMLVTLRDPSDQKVPCSALKDVKKKDWFYAPVCLAMQEKIVQGGKDGLFHPGDFVTLADASVMLARAYKLSVKETKQWFEGSIRALASAKAIPTSVEATYMRLTRAQVAEMLWRLQNNVTDQPSANADAVLNAQCDMFEQEAIAKVDMQEVQRVWLAWINNARAEEGLVPYSINKQLIRTAWIWSDQARDTGSLTHKRTPQAAYYDYKAIGKWFSNLGLDFANLKGTTYTENIGWGYVSCKQADCTGDMIKAIRSTFDFFMSEKGKAYAPHYNSIVNANFTEIGMGLVVEDSKYYLTTHYGTKITSNPPPICL